MNTYTNQQLRDWATKAQSHFADELDLFGLSADSVTITPAMARSVLAVVDSGPQPAVVPQTCVTAAPVLATLTTAPASKPQPSPQPSAARAALTMKAAERIQAGLPAVIEFLQSIAVNNEMPTRGAYDAQRGDLPSSSTLYKTGNLQWVDLAAQAGLTVTTRVDLLARYRVNRQDQCDLESVIAAVRAIAVNGKMPTQAEWDERKPDHMPTNATIRRALGMEWNAIADRAGLQRNVPLDAMYQARHGDKAKAKAQAKARAKAEQEADAAEPAAPFPALSDAAKSVLGPEHVAVTPYRNGNGRH